MAATRLYLLLNLNLTNMRANNVKRLLRTKDRGPTPPHVDIAALVVDHYPHYRAL